MSSNSTSSNNTSNKTHFVDVGPHRLAYRRTGSGPNVVFIHGWPLHGATWRDVVAGLGEATCYAFDLPGCGETVTPPNEPVSLRSAIDVMVRAIRKLELDNVVLVGNDSGGLIARQVAAQLLGQGDLNVAGLILIGTEIPGHHPKLIDQLQMLTKLPGSVAVTRKMLGSPAVARNKRMLGGCFWDRDLIEGSFRTELLAPVLAEPAALERQVEILHSYTHQLVDDLEEAHAAISCPTLLISGEGDGFFPPEQAKAMLSQFAGPTQFELVPKARLLVHEEQPALVAKLIRDFIYQKALVPHHHE